MYTEEEFRKQAKVARHLSAANGHGHLTYMKPEQSLISMELQTRTCTCGCGRSFKVMPASTQTLFSHYECGPKLKRLRRMEFGSFKNNERSERGDRWSGRQRGASYAAAKAKCFTRRSKKGEG